MWITRSSSTTDDPDVMHVEEDKVNYLYTSRSHEFLGANNTPDGIWKKTTGTDTIIGVIDTGIVFSPLFPQIFSTKVTLTTLCFLPQVLFPSLQVSQALDLAPLLQNSRALAA